MSTPTFVKPKKCTRCEGKGTVVSPVDFGRCFRCVGHGEVESDKATLAAKKAAVADRYEAGRLVREAGHEAHVGFITLEVREPDRFAKAVASVLAGHPGVIAALEAYGR